MEVSSRIREERERAGMSQEDLAQTIFVSRQTVSNWETGKTYPDVQSLLLLSNLFGVSVDSLVKGDVEAMEERIENYELDRFKIKMSEGLCWVLIIVGTILMCISVAMEASNVSTLLNVISFVIFAAAIVLAYVGGRIEKRYDIDTLKEVKAFLNGEEPGQIERNRKLPKAGRIVLKAVIGAAVGILLASVISMALSFVMFN